MSSSGPWQSRPPLRGAGSEHSRLRQWVHSAPHTDHLLHSDQAPSTAGTAGGQRPTAIPSPAPRPADTDTQGV